MGSVAGGIAVAVGVITRRAVRGEFHAARRLRELPNPGVGNSTSCRGRRIFRKCAAGRGRTRIVVDEKDEAL